MHNDFAFPLLEGMRKNSWRTAFGVLAKRGVIENINRGVELVNYAGTGKVTLWPAAIDFFPKDWHEEGMVTG